MRYYHGSKRIIKAGTVVRSRKSSFVRSMEHNIPATEAIFEQSRLRVAPDSIPRRDSVYMAGSPSAIEIKKVGGELGAIYEVIPAGCVERNHVGWWNMVSGEIADEEGYGSSFDEETLQLWADAYWSGESPVEHPLFARAQRKDVYVTFTGWEFRAKSFEILDDADSTVQFSGGRVFVNDRTTYLCLDKEADLEIYGLSPHKGSDGKHWVATSDRSSLSRIEEIISKIEAGTTPGPAMSSRILLHSVNSNTGIIGSSFNGHPWRLETRPLNRHWPVAYIRRRDLLVVRPSRAPRRAPCLHEFRRSLGLR